MLVITLMPNNKQAGSFDSTVESELIKKLAIFRVYVYLPEGNSIWLIFLRPY